MARLLARGAVVAFAFACLGLGLVALPDLDPVSGAVYAALAVVLVVPHVRVLPGLPLPAPDMAVTIGFLYVLGPAVLVIRSFAPIVPALLARFGPEAFRRELGPRASGEGESGLERFSRGWVLAWATFVAGLGVRWLIVQMLAPGSSIGPAGSFPPAHVVALAELGGYLAWAALAMAPLYPDRPLLGRRIGRGAVVDGAVADMALVVGLALTPFVFLITYGYRLHGLSGAAAWSLAALGLHVMLDRLNERRLTVERQNERLEGLHRELAHRERLSAIGEMSSVVSHQILQQLGAIGLFADATRNLDPALPPVEALERARRHADRIEGALADVNRTLTDLLVFGRDLRVHRYRHVLLDLVEGCLAECRPEAAGRGVELRVESGPGIEAAVDKLKLEQALANVVRNAIAVSSPGAEVRVRIGGDEATAWIEVEDQGPGVAAEDRERIFAPFFTTREQGTGLGLAIAREFLRAHDGSLALVGTAAGQGARFRLTVPRGVLEPKSISVPGG